MVEAAGVEPASEKALHEKPTCVARFRVFGHRRKTGKISGNLARLGLSRRLRTEAIGPACENDVRSPRASPRGRAAA